MWGWLTGLFEGIGGSGSLSGLAGEGSSSASGNEAEQGRLEGLNFVNSIHNTQNPFGSGIETGLGNNPGMVSPSWRR